MVDAAPPPSGSPWRHVRYVASAPAGNGMLLSRPGRLYFAELRVYTTGQQVTLYDHTNVPQNPLVGLVAAANGVSSPFPPVPWVTVPLERGLYLSFSQSAFTGRVLVGWERS